VEVRGATEGRHQRGSVPVLTTHQNLKAVLAKLGPPAPTLAPLPPLKPPGAPSMVWRGCAGPSGGDEWKLTILRLHYLTLFNGRHFGESM
jgi:hypothetical protein